MATIREYTVIRYNNVPTKAHCYVKSDMTGQTKYSQIPTLDEINAALGGGIETASLDNCFENCTDLIATPKVDVEFVTDAFAICNGCLSMKIAPSLGKLYQIESSFDRCTSLLQPPTIPDTTEIIDEMFLNCTNLLYPPSIPPTAKSIMSIFSGCTNMTGEMVVRSTSNYFYPKYALKDTTKPITLYGDKSKCEAIAATANNGNASWQPWYQPVPAVTNRGQGSYTTADDITRMVRNGALAVSSYAPGRMVYHQGDIVRADEWIALVEAAQTIDPTITLSTSYANLNAIEAAFDSAL